MSSNTYFAAKSAKETSEIVLSKANLFYNNLYMNGYLDKIKEMWMAYHGAYYRGASDGHKILFGGEQGELVMMAVNHLRNIAQHMLVMITSNRPAMQARATNTDYKSLVQTRLANDLLDYYMRDKRLEKYLKTAVEYAIVMGTGYIKMDWNATSGEVHDYNEETNTPIYEGDVEFTNLSPFDVMVDGTKEGQNHDWMLARTYKNKFDLAAKYPELKDKIENLPTKTDIYKYKFDVMTNQSTDDVPVHEFYHKRTESMPDGRYLLFLTSDVVLVDTALPYRELPIYRISPSDILGTPYGYTPLFDLLPIQDAINSLYSTIMTNQHAFGVQNIYIPRGADVTFSALEGGLNIIEGNAQMGKPEAMNLTATPPEIFQFLKMLEQAQETISGVSSVARGNPEASLKSGTALALVQSMTLQFISGLQQSYVEMIEDVGTGLINMLKDFASVPKVAMIAGKSNKSYLEHTFTGDDLSQVNRVIVDVGNPLMRCLAKDTPVLMYDGSIQMVQNIQSNDQIMGPDSKPRTIDSTYTGQEMMYEVTSKDSHRNIKYGCNESHIISLKYCSNDPRYNAIKGDIIDISVRDYNKLPDRHKRLLQGFTIGVEFKEKNLSVPPYILGAWLGDGHSASTALTSMDHELVDEWTNYAHSIGMEVRIQENRQPNKSKVYFITSGQAHGSVDRNPFMNELKSMEVINNKHIPDLYLKGSRQQRLELLAGLLDTDGGLVSETFIFTQKNDKLSDNIVFLAKSLGFRVTSKKVQTRSSELTGPITGLVNTISIGGNTHEIPTRLPRKQAKEKTKVRNWLNYGIKVNPVGFGDFYGFELKEEHHFILGDFTVTHNTTAGKVQIATELIQYGIVDNPKDYMTVLNTGNLDTLNEYQQNELLLVRAENEKMADGQKVMAIAVDQHIIHIKEHKGVLADPDLRNDPNLVQLVLGHINEHIELLRTTDPGLLTIIGEQPLGPQGGSPPGPPPPGAGMNPGSPPGPQGMAQQGPSPQPPPSGKPPNMPAIPHPPPPFNHMPTNPAQQGKPA